MTINIQTAPYLLFALLLRSLTTFRCTVLAQWHKSWIWIWIWLEKQDKKVGQKRRQTSSQILKQSKEDWQTCWEAKQIYRTRVTGRQAERLMGMRVDGQMNVWAVKQGLTLLEQWFSTCGSGAHAGRLICICGRISGIEATDIWWCILSIFFNPLLVLYI